MIRLVMTLIAVRLTHTLWGKVVATTLRTIISACGVGGDASGPRPGNVLPIKEALECGWVPGLPGGRRRQVDTDAFEIDRDSGQDVLDVGLGFTSVAAPAHAVAVDELADCAFDGGPQRVAREPFLGLLLGPGLGLNVVELAGKEREQAHVAAGLGGSDRTLAAVPL
ncbi:hypothetical protein ACTMUQ_43205 [Streptomyces sp. SD11]|uniref:hypothetical protein n=1 Tax=Streptomyces sp. SD11 TaxID=3452209 RepID=UPI003F8AE10E